MPPDSQFPKVEDIFISMFTMNIPVKAAVAVICEKCHEQIAEDAERCAACGCEMPPPAPKTLAGKIKRVLGIELSSDIITINLEDNGHFFTNQEIDLMLRMENFTVLGLEEIPDYDQMFYQSKRVRKPVNRKKG